MRVKVGIESSQGNWGKTKEGNPSGHLGPSIGVNERSLETLTQIVEELLGLCKALFGLFIHQLVKKNNVMINDFKSFILGITKCLSGEPSAQGHRPGLLASHSGPRSILQGQKATSGWGWGDTSQNPGLPVGWDALQRKKMTPTFWWQTTEVPFVFCMMQITPNLLGI